MKRSRCTRDDQESIGVVSRGAFNARGLSVAFTTSEPSPGRWIAVATVRASSANTHQRPGCMLVGRGRSETAAVANLRWRVTNSEPQPFWPEPSEIAEELDIVWEDEPQIALDP